MIFCVCTIQRMPRASSLGYLHETNISIPVRNNETVVHVEDVRVPFREHVVCSLLIGAVIFASYTTLVVAVMRSSV